MRLIDEIEAVLAGRPSPLEREQKEKELKREIYRKVGGEFFNEAQRLEDAGKDMCSYSRLIYALAAIGFTERTKQKTVPLRHLRVIAGCSSKDVLEMMEFFIRLDYVRKLKGGYGVCGKMAEFLREYLFGYPDFFEDLTYGA